MPWVEELDENSVNHFQARRQQRVVSADVTRLPPRTTQGLTMFAWVLPGLTAAPSICMSVDLCETGEEDGETGTPGWTKKGAFGTHIGIC